MPYSLASSGTLIPALYLARISALRSRLRLDTGARGSEKPRYNCFRTRFVACSRVYKVVPHRGLRAGALQHLVDAMGYGMVLMYIGHKLSMVPLTDHTPSKHERNRQIRARCIKGETVVELAQAFGISQQRVSQTLRGQRK